MTAQFKIFMVSIAIVVALYDYCGIIDVRGLMAKEIKK
jgi:hypothetical protein